MRGCLFHTSVPSFVGSLVQSIINDQEFLEKDLCQCGLNVKELEGKIKELDREQSKTMMEISKLQARLDRDYSYDRGCSSEKELIMEQIARKSGSAAAAVCGVLCKEEDNDFANNILGVVACLGTVQTNDLSRILAKYLGEDQMLAIVCKSSAYASNLVKYGPDGQVNSAYGLHAMSAKHGLPVNRKYLVICLENLRAYTGEICSNSRRKLALPDPTLSNGRPPPGYLGYAVNMIDPDVSHWHWKTPSRLGLRETLFYRLFGELQVYENREEMNKASSCITEGAVSLDGGIIMRSGVFIVGHWEPDIQFPVISQGQRHFPARSVGIMKQVEEKKQKLQETAGLQKSKQGAHKKLMKKFWKKHGRYKKFLNEKGPSVLRHCYKHLGLTPENSAD